VIDAGQEKKDRVWMDRYNPRLWRLPPLIEHLINDAGDLSPYYSAGLYKPYNRPESRSC